MYATEHNTAGTKPAIDTDSIAGRYLYYPDNTVARSYEAGLRCRGAFKRGRPDKPLVSVVSTVFNGGLTLERAICSVLSQSYDNVEYILIDANSTDNSLDIIRKYEDVIDYAISEPDDSLYEGMNKGVELSQGDFIIILNADDWYKPDCIETLVEHASKRSLDIVSALAVETDAKGKTIRNIPRLPVNNSIMFRMTLRHETMLVSRRLYNEVGLYDTNYRIIADLKFTQRVFRHTKAIKQLDEYLMFFRKIGVAHKVTDDLLKERKDLLLENFAFLNDTEVELLSEEYSRDKIASYRLLGEQHSSHEAFVDALKDFLNLHGQSLA